MAAIHPGDRIGKWTVIDTTLATYKDGYMVKCACDCGTERMVKLQSLTTGISLSCGCSRAENRTLHESATMIGQRFGKLVVESYSGSKDNQKLWLCKCDCGRKRVASTHALKQGHVKSCGCIKGKSHITHGETVGRNATRLYVVWNSMRARCNNPNNKAYKHYGGRGIKVCDEWGDYSAFREWAIDNGYSIDAEKRGCTIDRIDNNKGYSPDNCRFVSMREQNRNKRINRVIEYHGESKTLTEWAEDRGIKVITLWERIYQSGWSIEDALTKPVQKRDGNRRPEGVRFGRGG